MSNPNPDPLKEGVQPFRPAGFRERRTPGGGLVGGQRFATLDA
jgi:hypothetical protein